MENRFLLTLSCLGMMVPAALAQPAAEPLHQLLQRCELVPGETAAGARARAAVFSALGVLPADTDSFATLCRLGDFADLLGGTGLDMLGSDLLGELDGMALGMSQTAVRDLQRMLPLFEVLSEGNDELADAWVEKANDDAARAIVAQQRECQQQAAAKLVEATRNFHLAPIYLTLTCRPGGERLLQQLSVLPLMLPVEPDSGVEMMVRNGWRGFCLHGNRFNLEAANMAPEYEAQLQKNLQNARIYLAARAVKNHLVVVLCSNLDEVKLPSSPHKSLLNTDKMKPFDAYLNRQVWAAGFSSPAVVDLRESLNLHAYRSTASFIRGVLARMGSDNEAGPAAVDAVDALLNMLTRLMQPKKEAEQMLVWQEDAVYMHFVCDAGGQSFAPGQLTMLPRAKDADTVLYVASTPIKGTPEMNVEAVLDHVVSVQKGYLGTLNADFAKSEGDAMPEWQKIRPWMTKLLAGFRKMGQSLSGNGALLVRNLGTAATNVCPVHVMLQAETTDPAGLQESGAMVQDAVNELGGAAKADDFKLNIQIEGSSAWLSNVPGATASMGATATTPVGGGAVFSLNLAAAARAMEETARRTNAPEAQESAMQMRMAADYVEKVEGCARTSGNQLHTTLRFVPAQAK